MRRRSRAIRWFGIMLIVGALGGAAVRLARHVPDARSTRAAHRLPVATATREPRRPPGPETAPGMVEPPFVRKWTQLAGDQAFVVAVQDGVVYYASHTGLGALDLSSGERRWSNGAIRNIVNATVADHTLYALSQTETATTLEAFDLVTQHRHTLARLPARTEYFGMDTRHLYVLDRFATVRAYDPHSRVLLWSRSLQRGTSGEVSHAQLALTADTLYLGLDYAGLETGEELGLDTRDGRIRWRRPARFAGSDWPLVIGEDVISQVEVLKRFRARTGKVVWKAGEAEGATLVSNVVVSITRKQLVGRDVKNGRVLWRRPLRDPEASYGGYGSTLTDGESVWILRQPLLCVTKAGREKWHRSEPVTGVPVYVDREHLVTVYGERILGYGAGALPPLPTSNAEKRSLAERLVSQFEILDDAERGRLDKLAPFSFLPLLARYVELALAYEARPDDASSFDRFLLLNHAIPHLYATCRKEDTSVSVVIVKQLKRW